MRPPSTDEINTHANILRTRTRTLYRRMCSHVDGDDSLPDGAYVDSTDGEEYLHFCVKMPWTEDDELNGHKIVWWVNVSPYDGDGELTATYCREGGLPSFLASLHDARIAATSHDISIVGNHAVGEALVACTP